jgi:hypothetical protein
MPEKEKKVKCVIRIFEDNTAEILEKESLKNFLVQESAALTLLMTHGIMQRKIGKIEWVPVKKVKITK